MDFFFRLNIDVDNIWTVFSMLLVECGIHCSILLLFLMNMHLYCFHYCIRIGWYSGKGGNVDFRGEQINWSMVAIPSGRYFLFTDLIVVPSESSHN